MNIKKSMRNSSTTNSYNVSTTTLNESVYNTRNNDFETRNNFKEVIIEIEEDAGINVPKKISTPSKPSVPITQAANPQNDGNYYVRDERGNYVPVQRNQQYQQNYNRRQDSNRYELPPSYQQSTRGGRQQVYVVNEEDLEDFMYGFEDQETRRQFISIVFLILSCQLIFTLGFLVCVMYIPTLRIFVARNWIVGIVAFVLFFILFIAIMCYECTRKVFPLNFILLAMFTICFAYVAAMVTCRYKNYIIFGSIGITAGICICITLLALFIPCDITKYYMYFIIAGLVLMLFGLIVTILLIFIKIKILFMVYSGLIALFFSMYLWFDIQMIVGGKRLALDTDEYIAGAMTLYVDIMQIFLAIVTIFGGR